MIPLVVALLFELPFTGGPALDAVIEEAILKDQIPGAVLVVGHRGKILYEKAYGARALVPVREEMTLDTIFDVASLTKVVATTSSMMNLIEQGRVRLNDPVTAYIPEFHGGKTDITIRHLMTHFSGMRPFFEFDSGGYEAGIRLAINERPTSPPGTRFVYSDINYILLGEIVRRASGLNLDEYAREHIFVPAGMLETGFRPAADLRARIAPTELLPTMTEPLRGIVHDPRARAMDGIAGHAGLFSTAADLSKFAQVLINGGKGADGRRIFGALTVHAMSTPQSPLGQAVLRGLGWDIDSPYSSPRGDLFPLGSFGHTGFTGTSMWIDPGTGSYVILLTNSVHPKLRPAISPLRAKVANVVAGALNVEAPAILSTAVRHVSASKIVRNGHVLTGIDVLEDGKFAPLKGKRVGLITNHTGTTRDGRRNIDAMIAGRVRLRALYSPEHGLTGKQDHQNIRHTKDAKSGLPVYSLYAGENRRPSAKMLSGIDTLVFDIQDVGTRFYTYICTMRNAMEEAAKRKIEFVVLDRPNPINGVRVEGPLLEPEVRSFVGCIDMPLRHGMTVGELAQMVNATMTPRADLRVIKMRDWRREDWFDQTGLTWIDPSPNMRSLNAALLYPGVGMLELAKVYSVGRGTDAPFEQVGADWIRGRALADYLNNRSIPGIRIYPTNLRPTASNFAGKTIEGIRFVITDRNSFSSVRFGLELGSALAKLFPGKMNWKANEKLLGGSRILSALSAADDPATIEQSYSVDLERFRARRAEFLLY